MRNPFEISGKGTFGQTPQPGIEPGSRPRQGRVLTTILLRHEYLLSNWFLKIMID